MGATHFQIKTLKNVSTEMALHALAYNTETGDPHSRRWWLDRSDPRIDRPCGVDWRASPALNIRVFTQPGHFSDMPTDTEKVRYAGLNGLRANGSSLLSLTQLRHFAVHGLMSRDTASPARICRSPSLRRVFVG